MDPTPPSGTLTIQKSDVWMPIMEIEILGSVNLSRKTALNRIACSALAIPDRTLFVAEESPEPCHDPTANPTSNSGGAVCRASAGA
ncbi:hypothetical protein SAMN05446935_8689 [Burkholderia sp. YR290]|jgi:hypothetical protein|nr:hypothetical protein SAMN05446934_7821 [Paraburkholderia hospita]SOE89309.1 hypothetical protein SAMN05446935_8689 [Burkholderia sp. YR290]